jgi:DNA topoisomerase-3
MDANGIGTDATMAEHIAKIKDREYVATRPRGGGGARGVHEFIPTRLGIALVEGYDDVVVGLPDSPSLSKPFLRKEMELRMREICAGTRMKRDVVDETVEKYRLVYAQTLRRIEVLKAACRRYVFEQVDEREG